MEIRKEGRYFLFTRQDGKTAKYDLQTGDKISFTGRRVKSLSHFFKDTDTTRRSYWDRWRQGQVEINFGDDLANKMYRYITDRNRRLKAMDRILSEWALNYNAEKWMAIGYHVSPWARVDYAPADVPKKYRKMYGNYRDIHSLMRLDLKWIDKIYDKIKDAPNLPDFLRNKVGDVYNLAPRDMTEHEFNLIWELRQTTIQPYRLYTVRDSFRMAKALKIKLSLKDLSQENVANTHAKLVTSYNLIKEQVKNEQFLRTITDKWDWTDGTYLVRYPRSTKEIAQEGVDQHHCVRSYIDRIDDRMSILFLRRVDDPDTSLVTLERRNSDLWQAKAKFNHRPNDEVLDFLDKYCKAKKLTRRGY